MLVLCGEEDRYNCAELASYYPSTFDDMPEPEVMPDALPADDAAASPEAAEAATK